MALKRWLFEEAVGRLSGARPTLPPQRATAALDPFETLTEAETHFYGRLGERTYAVPVAKNYDPMPR